MLRAYEEIVDFIALGPSPDSVADFQPSQAAKERVAELIRYNPFHHFPHTYGERS